MTVVVISSNIYPSLFMYWAVSDMLVYKRHKRILLITIPTISHRLETNIYTICAELERCM